MFKAIGISLAVTYAVLLYICFVGEFCLIFKNTSTNTLWQILRLRIVWEGLNIVRGK